MCISSLRIMPRQWSLRYIASRLCMCLQLLSRCPASYHTSYFCYLSTCPSVRVRPEYTSPQIVLRVSLSTTIKITMSSANLLTGTNPITYSSGLTSHILSIFNDELKFFFRHEDVLRFTLSFVRHVKLYSEINSLENKSKHVKPQIKAPTTYNRNQTT